MWGWIEDPVLLNASTGRLRRPPPFSVSTSSRGSSSPRPCPLALTSLGRLLVRVIVPTDARAAHHQASCQIRPIAPWGVRLGVFGVAQRRATEGATNETTRSPSVSHCVVSMLGAFLAPSFRAPPNCALRREISTYCNTCSACEALALRPRPEEQAVMIVFCTSMTHVMMKHGAAADARRHDAAAGLNGGAATGTCGGDALRKRCVPPTYRGQAGIGTPRRTKWPV